MTIYFKHRDYTMKKNGLYTSILFLLAVTTGLMISGCTKDVPTEPVQSATPTVGMSVSFSGAGSAEQPRDLGVLFTDSLHIDSAIVVFSRIKFLAHADSEAVDSSDDDHDSDDHDSDDDEESVSFKGPFVVHVYDTVAIDLGKKELPAGTYDGIKFNIHKLKQHEHHKHCKKRHQYDEWDDPSVVGSSIIVWGSVYKDSAWQQFKFRFNGNLEFKIKGDFVVPATTSTVNIALHFDMGSWFRNPHDGTLLDPTDTSRRNVKLIRQAIRASFNHCRSGHDSGDGHHGD